MDFKTKEFYKSERTIERGTFHKAVGMYIGEKNNPACKENRNILRTMVPSEDWSDIILIESGVYKRNYLSHKKGDIKYRKVLAKYPSKLTPNIVAAWRAAYDYPTVSYGLACWRRETIIIDSDVVYESLDEAFKIITEFEKAFNIPQHNYILQNPSTGHCQFGWFIDSKDYFTKNDFPKFNEIIKAFAKGYSSVTGFEGDICFNGPACKNPFYEGFNQRFDSIELYNKKDFIKSSERIYYKLMKDDINTPLISPLYNNTVVTKKDAIYKYTSKKGSHTFGNETSRDYWEAKLLREWIWNYMRKHNNEAPSSQESRTQLNIIADDAAKLSGKGIRHSDTELNCLHQSTYKWAVSHYKQFKKDENCSNNNNKGAAFGRYIQSLRSYLLMNEIWKYKDSDYSMRQIADKVGCSVMTVSRSMKTRNDTEILSKIVSDIERFNDYCNKYDMSIEYTTLRFALNQVKDDINTLLYSPLYNNTVVTKDNEVEEYIKEESTINKKLSFAEWKLLPENIILPCKYESYQQYLKEVC